ncbi:hypothetical protein AWB81_07478 [Caballeronia arationis]|uniref:hypothetical protein n=1 Tax=Caballeronia arationis TaxID=1777142 RepID=UPI00074C816A|nr:hypothetical protein [Caballeronia arationis]SAL06177.1 hypothetical protein AWB81_07478 [Caballeronia arationis]
MIKHYDGEIGFDLGWDLARFGKKPDPEKVDEHVMRGYGAGLVHFPHPQHHADRFQAKWLQLRLSALQRGRIVQPEVTPTFLRMIDVSHCPVTLEELTHGMRAGTDWSVDRINNDGSYATWNLMVLSTRANKAKGNKGFGEVRRNSERLTDRDGLSPRQWQRLLCLMAGACGAAAGEELTCFPLSTRLPAGTLAPLYLHLQEMVLQCAYPATLRNRLIKLLNVQQPDAAQRARFVIACERVAALIGKVDYPYDALADARVQAFLAGWFVSLPETARAHLLKVCALFGGREVERGVIASWSLGTKGYIPFD